MSVNEIRCNPACNGEIKNRNYLNPIGFRFTVARFPEIGYFSNRASIPVVSLGVADQPTYLKNIMLPGDKLEFGELPIQFIVDEEMINYALIYNWMNGLGFPESCRQFLDWTADDSGQEDLALQYSDATLAILDSNYNTVAQVKFWDIFPTSLSSLDFDATSTDVVYLTANVTFSFTYMQLLDKNGVPLTQPPFCDPKDPNIPSNFR